MLEPGEDDAARAGTQASDAELVARVRRGTVDAFGELYLRHVASARRLACTLVPQDAVEDVVAEAVTRVLRTIRSGGGPDTAFRAYLLAAVRNLARDRGRSERRVVVTGDFGDGGPGELTGDADPVALGADAQADAELVAHAFAGLPPRWQAVLWELEVEGKTPASLAPLLGLSANGVAALAVRAREGLRQAYLQAHIATGIPASCEAHAGRLAAHARGRLGRRHGRAVHAHLECCPRCRGLYADLRELNEQLGAMLPPVAVGAGALAQAEHALHAGHAVSLAAKARWLWRLHPVTTAAAGVLATGGLVVAVGVLPPPASASHHPVPSLSAFSGTATAQAAHAPAVTQGACKHRACEQAAKAAAKAAKAQAKAAKAAARASAKAAKAAARASAKAARAQAKGTATPTPAVAPTPRAEKAGMARSAGMDRSAAGSGARSGPEALARPDGNGAKHAATEHGGGLAGNRDPPRLTARMITS